MHVSSLLEIKPKNYVRILILHLPELRPHDHSELLYTHSIEILQEKVSTDTVTNRNDEKTTRIYRSFYDYIAILHNSIEMRHPNCETLYIPQWNISFNITIINAAIMQKI